jgi:hypothetical protein
LYDFSAHEGGQIEAAELEFLSASSTLAFPLEYETVSLKINEAQYLLYLPQYIQCRPLRAKEKHKDGILFERARRRMDKERPRALNLRHVMMMRVRLLQFLSE